VLAHRAHRTQSERKLRAVLDACAQKELLPYAAIGWCKRVQEGESYFEARNGMFTQLVWKRIGNSSMRRTGQAILRHNREDNRWPCLQAENSSCYSWWRRSSRLVRDQSHSCAPTSSCKCMAGKRPAKRSLCAKERWRPQGWARECIRPAMPQPARCWV